MPIPKNSPAGKTPNQWWFEKQIAPGLIWHGGKRIYLEWHPETEAGAVRAVAATGFGVCVTAAAWTICSWAG